MYGLKYINVYYRMIVIPSVLDYFFSFMHVYISHEVTKTVRKNHVCIYKGFKKIELFMGETVTRCT